MTFEDDETLQMYVEESLEHLSHIENDLLAIEAGGSNVDEEIVNNVFRAAHSIKGGAGFMGLTNIKELSHKIENILGMIRSRELVPTTDMISILLKAFDKLQNLILNVGASNETDISGYLKALMDLAGASLSEGEKAGMGHMTDVLLPNGSVAFTVPQFDINQAQKDGKFIYLVEMDLLHDIQRKNKTPLDVTTSLLNSGVIIESKIDFSAVGTLEAEGPNRIPFRILFASIIEPDIIPALFEVEPEYVHAVQPDMLRPAGTASPPPDRPSQPRGSAGRPPQERADVNAPAPEGPPLPDPGATPAAPAPAAVPSAGSRQEPPDVEEDGKPSKIQTSLRVNVSLLDALMTLAGELVLSRNQLLQGISAGNQRALEITAQRIDHVTSELQEAIMRTRMQALANVFNKFPRVVRDLAQSLGKEVELSIEGKNVELDKTIIEAISDPLTHLVRNAVDHGIEPPDVRRSLGKQPVGQVCLRAYHEAGQVNIEIFDDGAGLDGDKIAGKAMQKGLVSESQVRLMSEKEKIALIFLPGFSTAETVTDISGRGVGMDVVKTNLDKLGGIVDIDTKAGEGTTIRIKLPLTLAIIPSQVIAVGKERYAIPQVNLDELLRIPASQVKERVEKVGDAAVVRLRGNLLPLLELRQVLGIERTFINPKDGREYPDRRVNIADRRSRQHPLFQEPPPPDDSPAEPAADAEPAEQSGRDNERRQRDRRYHATSALNIAVVSAGSFKYGLVVDELRDSEEIVVKPLGRHLKDCHGYAGATIMGDGKVALILDVVGIAQMAGLTSLEGTDAVAKAAQDAIEAEKARQEQTSLLLFRNAPDEQFAVPLNLVERIERIENARIETVGGKKVIQYRGGTLTLFGIEEAANVKPRPERDNYEVIVFMISGREVGLLALPPVDAVETAAKVDASSLRQPGIRGSMIIGEKTTLMVDMFEVVKLLNPEWFDSLSQKAAARQPVAGNAQILLVEDSQFFRDQIKSFLEEEGYPVLEATNGEMAWQMLEEHWETVRLMVTDLEMPSLDGFELSSKIKQSNRFKNLPIIALTSLADEEAMERGRRVGIDEYQLKLDREKLIASIRTYFTN